MFFSPVGSILTHFFPMLVPEPDQLVVPLKSTVKRVLPVVVVRDSLLLLVEFPRFFQPFLTYGRTFPLDRHDVVPPLEFETR
jgi:hypothetical protein